MTVHGDERVLAVTGTTDKNDVRVEIVWTPYSGENRERPSWNVTITSPVKALFGEYQRAAVDAGLREWEPQLPGRGNLEVRVTDNQALDFVIAARVRAATAKMEMPTPAEGMQ